MDYTIIGQHCYLLAHKSSQIILDIGSGSLVEMTEKDIDYGQIDHVYISSLNPENVTDLPALILSRILKEILYPGKYRNMSKLNIYANELIYEDLEIILEILTKEFIEIGKTLKLYIILSVRHIVSPSVPLLHTVHETFTSYGVPSIDLTYSYSRSSPPTLLI